MDSVETGTDPGSRTRVLVVVDKLFHLRFVKGLTHESFTVVDAELVVRTAIARVLGVKRFAKVFTDSFDKHAVHPILGRGEVADKGLVVFHTYTIELFGGFRK
jgi:hypothetical protein